MDNNPINPEDAGLPITLSALLPFEKPQQFVHITDNIFTEVSRYMTVVILTATTNRTVDLSKIFANAKYMFSEKSRRSDTMWKQHVAASLREAICFIEQEHYRTAFQSIPTNEDPTVEGIFSFIDISKAYLSSVVHHQETSKIGQVDRLYPRQGFGQMDLATFQAQESDILERVCIDLVFTLHNLFATYCMTTPRQST